MGISGRHRPEGTLTLLLSLSHLTKSRVRGVPTDGPKLRVGTEKVRLPGTYSMHWRDMEWQRGTVYSYYYHGGRVRTRLLTLSGRVQIVTCTQTTMLTTGFYSSFFIRLQSNTSETPGTFLRPEIGFSFFFGLFKIRISGLPPTTSWCRVDFRRHRHVVLGPRPHMLSPGS